MTDELKPGDRVTIPRVVLDRPGALLRHERWPATVIHVRDRAVSVVFENPYHGRREGRETLPLRRVHRALT